MTEQPDQRTLAQFFFEVGFGACFAEVMISNGMKPPFDLSDEVLERQWDVSQSAFEDPAEFDARLDLADAAPELVAALSQIRDIAAGSTTANSLPHIARIATAAIAKVTGGAA